MSEKKCRVVIVGGGYVGLEGYKFMKRQIKAMVRRGEVEVTLISPKTYHSFHGWTAEALTGIISINNRQSPLRRLLVGQRLLQGRVVNIDLENRRVQVEHVDGGATTEVEYDHLLLANGTVDNMQAVPGLPQHGWTVKSPGGVLATRNRLLAALDVADSLPDGPEQDAWLTVVIAGGGFAGVEFAAAIAEMHHVFKKYYPVLERKTPRVVLVHSRDQLLEQLRPKYARLADYCTRELEKWDVDIRCNTRLEEVTDDGAKLSDGSFIPSHTVICTVGQRIHVIPGTENLPRTSNGRLVTDKFLRVDGYDNIWTGGDTAQVLEDDGKPSPANALSAIMHGRAVGRNLGRAIAGDKLEPYASRGFAQAASMGVGKGASEIYGRQVTGWFAWTTRFMFFAYVQPSRRQAIRVALDWLTLPFTKRYMTVSEEWQQKPEVPQSPAP